jgi:hypothetical protein
MEKVPASEQSEMVFDPLKVMGVFWLIFGVIVLFATFFIKATPRVPLVPSVITNIIAGSLLTIAGVVCLLKAKHNAKVKKGCSKINLELLINE